MMTLPDTRTFSKRMALGGGSAVLDVERELKHAQLTLMVEVENELTAEQRATAHKLEAGTR